jgi:hypothetical protein
MKAVAYVVDLMDSSKITAAGKTAGMEVRIVRSHGAAVEAGTDADVVVVDLSRPDALEVIGDLSSRVRVVAYGAHVDLERLRAASDAGAESVLARSAFFGALDGWLRG